MPKVPESVKARPPLERMYRLFHLIQQGEYPNCSTLAKEFEVTTRSIKRDVDFLKCRYHLPIEYDAKRYGYYFTHPVKEFPNVPITEAEMFSLLVAQKAVARAEKAVVLVLSIRQVWAVGMPAWRCACPFRMGHYSASQR